MIQEYSPSDSAQTSNVSPTVNITTSNQTVDAGETISLAATATDQGGGTIASYLWTGNGTFDNDDVEDPDWTAPSPNSQTSYTLRLTATDDEGAEAFDTVIITVRAILVAPSFSDNTGDEQNWTVGTAITNIQVPTPTGNPTPTYAVVGTLPAGISFNTSTGFFLARRLPLVQAHFGFALQTVKEAPIGQLNTPQQRL